MKITDPVWRRFHWCVFGYVLGALVQLLTDGGLDGFAVSTVAGFALLGLAYLAERRRKVAR